MESAAAAAAGVGARLRRYLQAFLLIGAFLLSGVSGFVGVNINYPAAEAEAGLLPKPGHIVDLLNILQIQQIKLLQGTHHSLIEALSGSDAEVLLTVSHDSIGNREVDTQWLDSNVFLHIPAIRITGIVVSSDKKNLSQAIEAMKTLHSSLAAAGLEKQIKVTSSVSEELISRSSWPSSSKFKRDYLKPMHELLDFLAATDSYLMIDMSPFDAHLRGKKTLQLAMPSTPATHESFLDAALDSFYFSMRKLASNFSRIPVVVGSIGWPWSSDESPAASPENAAIFTRSLVKRCMAGSGGTPYKPELPINVYLHQLLDDHAASSGSRFGMFSLADQLPRFGFDLTQEASGDADDGDDQLARRVLADNGTSNGTSSGGTSTGGGQYCVAKDGAPDNLLSVGLNWACGQGNADCSPIQQNGACYLPDTYANHASYAFNSYWQKNSGAGATCDFQGAAMLVTRDPSYNSCIYTSGGSSTGGGGGTGTGGAGSPTSSSSSGGIQQPFNPSGSSSGATSLSVGGAATTTLVVAIFFVWWSFRV